MDNTIISAVRDFMRTFPKIGSDATVSVDFLAKPLSFSIETEPCDPVVQRFVDGGARLQFLFALMSKEMYDEDARIGIDNSGFYLELDKWIRDQDRAGNYPNLPSGLIPCGITTTTCGYVYDQEGNYAAYRIEFRLLYEEGV